jgi:hypothetical protein
VERSRSQCEMSVTPYRRYGLVTLMELLTFYAHTYWGLAFNLGQLITFVDHSAMIPGAELKNWVPGEIGKTLGEIHYDIERLDLPALKQSQRIRDWFEDDRSRDYAELTRMMKDLALRISDDLSERLFLAVPREAQRLYAPAEPLFGKAVEAKFPKMSEDIAEAGKCLALQRSTACVFHLMRVMERGVQYFGDELGVQLVEQKVWQIILDGITSRIRKLDAKKSRTTKLAAAASHLYNVKIAWRNEVMHPKQTYTNEEAGDIYRNVRTFICDLAESL